MGWMQRAVWIVEDILKHHDQELQTIDLQIAAEQKRLDDDLESIRARAYPGAIQYDVPRVQSSPDSDQRFVTMADAIRRRTARANRIIADLERRRDLIEYVHDAIFGLDSRSVCLLLTLYYPTRTYNEAAEILGMDVSTLARQRRGAVEALARRIPDRLLRNHEAK